MILVGIGQALHDCSIAASINGKVKYRKHERQFGVKHSFAPVFWYRDVLNEWGIDFDDIDGIAFTDVGTNKQDTPGGPYHWYVAPFCGSPYIKQTVEGNHKCYVGNIPHGFHGFFPKSKELYLMDHHYAHHWSNTKVDENTIGVSQDGSGSDAKTCLVVNGSISPIMSDRYVPMGSILVVLGRMIGLARDLGFVDLHNDDDSDICGKMMGLQAYGKIDQSVIDIWKHLVPYKNGLFCEWMKDLPINYSVDNPDYLSLLASAFQVGYIGAKHQFGQFKDKDVEIAYTGGIALNVNWNRWLLDEGFQLNIEPHVYDGGLSIGCLRFLANRLGEELDFGNFPYIQDDEAPETTPTDETIERVAELLADGKIVGWYQGHGEIGPRALGNRSILMNPSIKNGKDILNQKVKRREWWRPFGASVKQDKAHEYFDLHDSPYMLFSAQVLKDGLDAITHVDGSCRHQTVTPDQNKIFYKLLDAFEEKTGLPILLNTSLNLGGKPIAGTMAEAIELFQTTEMDALCLGNHLILK